MSQRRNRGGARQYPRTARLNELLREILAEELASLDDDRLQLITVTAVDVDADLRLATVFYDSLDGEEGDEEILAALEENRWRLKGAIARQARIKRTPELTFSPDLAVRQGARIEELLSTVVPSTADDAAGDVTGGDATAAGDPTEPPAPA